MYITRSLIFKLFTVVLLVFALAGALSVTFSGTAHASPVSKLSVTIPLPVAGCKPSFPGDATATWYNNAYQGWVRPVEGSDRHFNYALQNCGPSGPYSYVVNFHVTLLSLNKGEWQTSDSKQGTKTWGGSSGYLCSNWYDAGYAITNYVAGFAGSGYSGFYTATVDQVLGEMNVQLNNACGN